MNEEKSWRVMVEQEQEGTRNFEEVRAARLSQALELMSPQQRHRFEHFCRSRFNHSAIRQLLIENAGSAGLAVSSTMAIVVAGLAKLYVGDIVEKGAFDIRHIDVCCSLLAEVRPGSLLPPPTSRTARIIMEERGESGAIQPRHLREAHRVIQAHDEVIAQGRKRRGSGHLLQGAPRLRRRRLCE
jgi:hypothetical protein